MGETNKIVFYRIISYRIWRLQGKHFSNALANRSLATELIHLGKIVLFFEFISLNVEALDRRGDTIE